MGSTRNFQLTFKKSCDGGVACVAVSHERRQPHQTLSDSSSRFAVASHRSTIFVLSWVAPYGRRVQELAGPPEGATALCFSHSSNIVYVGGGEGWLSQHSLAPSAAASGNGSTSGDSSAQQARQLILTGQGEARDSVLAICSQPNDGLCLAAACGRFVHVLDEPSGKVLQVLGPLGSKALALKWLGKDRLVAGHGAGFTVWQRQSSAAAAAGGNGAQTWEQMLQYGASDSVYSRIAVSEHGIVAAACSSRKEVHVWRTDQWLDADDAFKRAASPLVLNKYQAEVEQLAWDPRGQYLATCVGGVTIAWDFGGCISEPKRSVTCGSHDQGSHITALCFSADGRFLVTAGDDAQLLFFCTASFPSAASSSSSSSVVPQATLSLGMPPQPVAGLGWVEPRRLIVAVAAGGVLEVEVDVNSLADPQQAGTKSSLCGMGQVVGQLSKMGVNDVHSPSPARVALPPAAAAPPPSVTRGALHQQRAEAHLPASNGIVAGGAGARSARPEGTPAVGRDSEVDEHTQEPGSGSQLMPGGPVPPVRVRPNATPETPQRRKEHSSGSVGSSGRGSLSGGRGSRGQAHNGGPGGASRGSGGTFTSNVMRPSNARGSGQPHHRSSSPTRSTGSSKDSGVASLPGMQAWMYDPAGAGAGGMPHPAWGAMPPLPPGMPFPPMPPFVAQPGMPAMPPGATHPAMLGPHPGMLPFYFPRAPMAGAMGIPPGAVPVSPAGAGAGSGSSSIQASPRAGDAGPRGGSAAAAAAGGMPPGTLMLPGPMGMGFPTMAGPLGYHPMYHPGQQPNQWRQLVTMQQAQAQYLAQQHQAMVEAAAAGHPGLMASMGAADAAIMRPHPGRFEPTVTSHQRSSQHTSSSGGVGEGGPSMGEASAAAAGLAFPYAAGLGGPLEVRPPGTTLYVGNLAPMVNEAVLVAAFQYYGQVTSAQVIRDKSTNSSRGFGFVSFKSPAHATAAMQSMNLKTMIGPFEGRQIKVAPSTRMNQAAQAAQQASVLQSQSPP